MFMKAKTNTGIKKILIAGHLLEKVLDFSKEARIKDARTLYK